MDRYSWSGLIGAACAMLALAGGGAQGAEVPLAPEANLNAAGARVQQTVAASAPLQVMVTESRALLTNVSGRTLDIQVFTQDLEGHPGSARNILRQRGCQTPLPQTTGLAAWQTACLAPAGTATTADPVTYWLSTTNPAWFAAVTLPVAPELTPVVGSPELTTVSFTPPVVDCTVPGGERLVARRADGLTLNACRAKGGHLGRPAADQVWWPAGVYRGLSARVSMDAKPAVVTVNVRAPWWWALGLVVLGLLAPALLKFTADRHRDRRQIELAVAEEGMTLRDPPARKAGPFTLDIEDGSWRTGPFISPLEPYGDIRDKWRALAVWRELLGDDPCAGTLPQQLSKAILHLRGVLGGYTRVTGSSAMVAVLNVLQGIADGSGLGMNPKSVPVSRAADVVGSVKSALALARDLERLDLPALAKSNPAGSNRGLLVVLERHIYDLAPARSAAADLDTYRLSLQTLTDAVVQATYPASGQVAGFASAALNRTIPAALPAWPGSLDVARRRANVEVRMFTGPLLVFALIVTSAVAMKLLYADTPDWGARGWLDYAYTLAGGSTGFALSALLEDAVRRLSGSALSPGLLRVTPAGTVKA